MSDDHPAVHVGEIQDATIGCIMGFDVGPMLHGLAQIGEELFPPRGEISREERYLDLFCPPHFGSGLQGRLCEGNLHIHPSECAVFLRKLTSEGFE